MADDLNTTVMGDRARKERGFLQVGDVVLGRYTLEEKLGTGAMGMVFKGRDRVSGESYALKMVPPELARDENVMENIRQNFRLVHNLKHPNIAGTDFLEQDEYGAYFLIMEYAKGESLARWILKSGGKAPVSEVVSIVKQIASALDYAHEKKVLHRDIKPANVMIDENGEVKVLDFGLASKVRSSQTSLSVNVSNSSGTPNYMPPEQFKARYPRPASDQYALAVMTYEMLTGHLPFEADNFEILRAAVINEEPEQPDELSDAVWAALKKAMSKDPKDRFESCSAFVDELSRASEPPKPEPEPAKPEAPKTEPKPEPAKEEPKPELKSEPAEQETTTSAPSNIPQSDLRWTGCTDLPDVPKTAAVSVVEEKKSTPTGSLLPDAATTGHVDWMFHLKAWSFFLLIAILLHLMAGTVSIKYYYDFFYDHSTREFAASPYMFFLAIPIVCFAWLCLRKIVNNKVFLWLGVAVCVTLISWPVLFYLDVRFYWGDSTAQRMSLIALTFSGIFIFLFYILETLLKIKYRMRDIFIPFAVGAGIYAILYGPYGLSLLKSKDLSIYRIVFWNIVSDYISWLCIEIFLIYWLRYKRRPWPIHGLCYGFIVGMGFAACLSVILFLDSSRSPENVWGISLSLGIIFIFSSILGALAGFCLNQDCRLNKKKFAMTQIVIIMLIIIFKILPLLLPKKDIFHWYVISRSLEFLCWCVILYLIQWFALAKGSQKDIAPSEPAPKES